MQTLEQQTLWSHRQAAALYLVNRIERSLQASGFFLNATSSSQTFSETLQNQPHLAAWQCALTDNKDRLIGLQPIRFNRCSDFHNRSGEQGIFLSYVQQEYSAHQTLWCDQPTKPELDHCLPLNRWYLMHEGYQLGHENNRGKLFYVWADYEDNQLKFYREVIDSEVLALGFKYMLKTRNPKNGKFYYRYIDAQLWHAIDFNLYAVVAVQISLSVAVTLSSATNHQNPEIQLSRWVVL